MSSVSNSPILIQGQGVAACCCAQLLGAAGFRVAVERDQRRGVPALVVGDATQALMRDVFERDAFEGCPQIERRVVAWGNAEPVTVPHRAVVIPEEELVRRLVGHSMALPDMGTWTILTSRAAGPERRFGTRIARAASVELEPAADAASCYVESLASGWLFLAGGWLLAVGDASLEQSELIRRQVAGVGPSAGEFPAYPRVAEEVGGPGWLCCGSAALTFDPLCGDGTGNAAREAILASAVIRAAARGIDVEELLAHYRARLWGAFRKHLEICRGFYESGGDGAWWRSELAMIQKGIDWAGHSPTLQRQRFRLRGWELEPAG